MKKYIVNEILSNEDSEPYADEIMLIVCDGLGGSGCSSHIVNNEQRSSAYLASRFVSKCVQTYVELNFELLWSKDESEIEKDIKNVISNYLEDQIRIYGLSKTIQGSAMHLLPTTLAMAVYRNDGEKIEVLVIWAGDSRVYCMDADNGLQQLSIDDVDGDFDAYRLLGTSNMSNCICADEDFYINCIRYEFSADKDMFLFCSSDGCFDHISTPMDLEYFYLSALQNVKNEESIESYGGLIGNGLRARKLKDDCTIAGVCFSEKSIQELKQCFWDRTMYIKNRFRQATYQFALQSSEINRTKDNLNKSLDIAMRSLPEIVSTEMISMLENNFEIMRNLESCSKYFSEIETYNIRLAEYQKEDNKLCMQYEELEREAYSLFSDIYIKSVLQNSKDLLERTIAFFTRNVRSSVSELDNIKKYVQIRDDLEMELRRLLQLNVEIAKDILMLSEIPKDRRDLFTLNHDIEILWEQYEKSINDVEDALVIYKNRIIQTGELQKAYNTALKGRCVQYDDITGYYEFEQVRLQLMNLEKRRNEIKREFFAKKISAENFYYENKKIICKELFNNYSEIAKEYFGAYPEVLSYLDKIKEKNNIEHNIKEHEKQIMNLWEEYRITYEKYRGGNRRCLQ